MPGRSYLLPPFTRLFRLGFALLRGGSRINHHRAGVLSLQGCPTCAFRPHAPYRTGFGASKYSRDCPRFLIPLLGSPATRTRCPSSCLLLKGLFSCSQVVQSLSSPTGVDGVLVMRDSKLQSCHAIELNLSQRPRLPPRSPKGLLRALSNGMRQLANL